MNCTFNFFIYVFLDEECREILKNIPVIKYLLRRFPPSSHVSSMNEGNNNMIELNEMNGTAV